MTEIAGLSLALGAFIAGMLISETEFKHRVEEDIKPFRDVLLGLFFVTIGMLLNVRVVIDNFGWVILALVVPGCVQVQPDFRSGAWLWRDCWYRDPDCACAGDGGRIRIRVARARPAALGLIDPVGAADRAGGDAACR